MGAGVREQHEGVYCLCGEAGWGERKRAPKPPRVAPAVWQKIAWAMFEVEAGRRNVNASPEKDAVFEAMKEGVEMAFPS